MPPRTPQTDRHAKMFALLRQGDQAQTATAKPQQATQKPAPDAQHALRDYAINSFRRPA